MPGRSVNGIVSPSRDHDVEGQCHFDEMGETASPEGYECMSICPFKEEFHYSNLIIISNPKLRHCAGRDE